MRTKFKAWSIPYLNEHKEVLLNENSISFYDNFSLEIGSGKGLFLLEMAKKFPDRFFIGIEKNVTCAAISAKKLVENDISNAKLVYMDAEKLLPLIIEESVDNLYLNFSDPWPKIRHHKRRLTSNKFLPLYERILKKNGKLIMKTDNSDLFDFSLELFKETNFKLEEINFNYDGNDSNDVMSEYETNFRKENKPIYRLIAVK